MLLPSRRCWDRRFPSAPGVLTATSLSVPPMAAFPTHPRAPSMSATSSPAWASTIGRPLLDRRSRSWPMPPRSQWLLGPWTFSPTVMTNDFFQLLLSEKWQWKKWDGPKQDTRTRATSPHDAAW